MNEIKITIIDDKNLIKSFIFSLSTQPLFIFVFSKKMKVITYFHIKKKYPHDIFLFFLKKNYKKIKLF